jgi:hypothetical protein
MGDGKNAAMKMEGGINGVDGRRNSRARNKLQNLRKKNYDNGHTTDIFLNLLTGSRLPLHQRPHSNFTDESVCFMADNI